MLLKLCFIVQQGHKRTTRMEQKTMAIPHGYLNKNFVRNLHELDVITQMKKKRKLQIKSTW